MNINEQEQTNIVAAKIVRVTRKNVTVVTEEGRRFKVPLNKSYQHDRTMLASLKDILKAGIWIPVNKKLKQLFQYDWLTGEQPALAVAKN